MVITEIECGTKMGIPKRAIYKGEEVDVPLREAIIGRTSRQAVINPMTDEVIVAENQLITPEIALRIEKLGIDSVQVRSPLICDTSRGKCAMCYGMDMSTGQLVEEGLAVGTIAAQSIGEPGTQLTDANFPHRRRRFARPDGNQPPRRPRRNRGTPRLHRSRSQIRRRLGADRPEAQRRNRRRR